MARLSLAHSLHLVRPFFKRFHSTRDSIHSHSSTDDNCSNKDRDSIDSPNTTDTSINSSPKPTASRLRVDCSGDLCDADSPTSSEECFSSPTQFALPPPLAASQKPASHGPDNLDEPVIVFAPASGEEDTHQQAIEAAEPAHVSLSHAIASPHDLPTSAIPTSSNAPTHSHDKPLANPLTVTESQDSVLALYSDRDSSVSDGHETLPYHLTSSHPPAMALTTTIRKIWVKRPGASATLVQIREDDLVDDVRDMILKKYANSLGRTFDSPDMTLRIMARGAETANVHRVEHVLGPDEEMCRVIDEFYPTGQKVDDALLIDVPVPQKRTPRPSPRNVHQPQPYVHYHPEDTRPLENGTDYFPPMIVAGSGMNMTLPVRGADHPPHDYNPKSISVLNTGQIAPLPSPGARGGGARPRNQQRPGYGRQHTSSPVILSQHARESAPGAAGQTSAHLTTAHRPRPRVDSSASDTGRINGHINGTNGVSAPAAPPLPSPPAPPAVAVNPIAANQPPPTPGASRANGTARPARNKGKRPSADAKSARRPSNAGAVVGGAAAEANGFPATNNSILSNISSMLDNSVPPINVLIVEDNSINLRVMEMNMKRLKVRWQTAMNGKIAVDKWKRGGFHLVLMDIQMPIMNGIQATKEIRRLERVNGIGVFSSAPGSPVEHHPGGGSNGAEPQQPSSTATAAGTVASSDDSTLATGEGLFKSPVIIVALTASSLQSDREEALAAGCNDFLTKPVSFLWLERKVKEWGCMQALIDFDGWRKWRDVAAEKKPELLASAAADRDREKQEREERKEAEKRRKKEAKDAAAAAAAAVAEAPVNGEAEEQPESSAAGASTAETEAAAPGTSEAPPSDTAAAAATEAE